MENRNVIILTVIFVLVIALAVVGYNYLAENYVPEEAPAPQMQPEKIQAPDFEVMNNSGEFIKLSDFKGRNIVINFWATWCGPCKSELPAFDNLYKKYGDRVEFLMVNLTDGTDETVDKVKSFVKENNYSFPVYFDTKLDGANAYYVYSIPYTVLIDTDGNIFASHPGAMSEKTLENYITGLIN